MSINGSTKTRRSSDPILKPRDLADFFTYFKWRYYNDESPWLIVGKGPSFEKYSPTLRSRYHVMGLNDVVRASRVDIAHVIDVEVLNRCPFGFQTMCEHLVLPWVPHFKHRPKTTETLDKLCHRMSWLGALRQKGLLTWYNCSTGVRRGTRRVGCPPVKVRYFSSEAAVRLLAMAGVRKIRTLGIDGGTDYAPQFQDLTPLSNTRERFDDQFGEIAKTVKEFGLDYGAL